MKILLLSFYYPPDIGPGPLRAESIANGLIRKSNKSIQIDVLTTMPNRYHNLISTAKSVEHMDKVTVYRFPLPEHKSGMLDQSIAFFSFAISVLKKVRGQQYDIVVATSSRLMTASLGAWVSKRLKAQLYLDIRDLFTDTMEDLLHNKPSKIVLPLLQMLERWTFLAASKINVVSSGFTSHVVRVTNGQVPSVFTNGIDDEFLSADFTQSSLKKKPNVVYAGNMGDGQGLQNIIPEVAIRLANRVDFNLIGNGGKRKEIEEILIKKSINNVRIHNPVQRTALLNHYKEADILFLHLNDFKAFQKVLPSKIFEFAATGKPILAGVSGHAADFLREHVPGVEVFNPCDVDDMIAGLTKLLDGPKYIDRSAFVMNYRRERIMDTMADEILLMDPT